MWASISMYNHLLSMTPSAPTCTLLGGEGFSSLFLQQPKTNVIAFGTHSIQNTENPCLASPSYTWPFASRLVSSQKTSLKVAYMSWITSRVRMAFDPTEVRTKVRYVSSKTYIGIVHVCNYCRPPRCCTAEAERHWNMRPAMLADSFSLSLSDPIPTSVLYLPT